MMLGFVARRLALAVPTLLGVVIVAFGVLYVMPGDPVKLLVQSFETGGSPAQIAAIRRKFGLDDPLPVQFVHFLLDALHGDFGRSILQNRPVGQLLMEALPQTLELAALALIVSVVMGVGFGVLAAAHHGTWIDRASIVVSLLAVSVPQFYLAILAVIVFSVKLQLFPSSGVGGIEFLILPAAVLGIRSAASIARLTRSSVMEVMPKQFVTTARAKGMPEPVVMWLHTLKNALIPVVTVIGLEMGYLIGGAVIVEAVFARTGLGSLLVDAIVGKDIPVLRAAVLTLGGGYVILNLLVDLSYGWLDPRIRAAS
jgi:peptide/nickel transport system permease protein